MVCSGRGWTETDFCVVGAGRMGASIAGHLVLQGARVALFDRSDYDRYALLCRRPMALQRGLGMQGRDAPSRCAGKRGTRSCAQT